MISRVPPTRINNKTLYVLYYPPRALGLDVCTLAFQGAVGEFPPEAAEIRPAVVFRNNLFLGEERDNAVVSVRGDAPMSPVLHVMDNGVAMIPPVTDRHVQQTVSRSVGWDTYSV